MIRAIAIVVLAALALGGCTSAKESDPARTATEQLLISSAADRAAQRLNLGIPPGTKVFVDAANFEGTDGKYAVGAIRDRFLRAGMALVAERKDAAAVVEIRSGALSVDREEFLIGIPDFVIPIPLAGEFTFPEIALYKDAKRRAIAKFAAVGYGAGNGRLISSTAEQYGFSHKTEKTILLFLSWERTDAVPKEQPEEGGDHPPGVLKE
ncbi:MAG: hypothetical protein GEU92_04320 [Alphaproteobacteria bacterium]|nr:hypothetical protein [Alphaproteobacteria bacterium]